MVTDLSFTCHEQLWIVLFHFSEIRQIFRNRGGDAEKSKHLCLINDGMLNKNKWQPLLLNLRVTCCLFSGLSAKGSLLLVAWGKDLFSSMTGQTRIRASSKFVIDNFITFKVIWVSYFSYSPDVTITSERMFKTKTNSVCTVHFVKENPENPFPLGCSRIRICSGTFPFSVS